jgi:integrase
MATEKIGVYRRWLEDVPRENGKLVPKKEWPKKRRHSWVVRWFGRTGKRYSKNFKTKKEADRFTRNLQLDINQGRPDKPDKITLNAFTKEHQKITAGQVAYATLCDQIRALRFFEKFIGGSTFLENIKPKDAEAYIANRLSSGVSIATVNKDIRTLKRIFNLAIDPRGYLQKEQNPFKRIKQRKKSESSIRYVEIDEYKALLNSTDKLWWKSLISLAYCSGLRRGEIFNLIWKDVDFENKLLSVTPKQSTNLTVEWEPKDHQKRVAPLSDHTIELLAELQLTAPEGYSYIFISPRRFEIVKNKTEAGQWTSRCAVINNVGRDFGVIRRRAGVKQCSLHDLRRSAITNWAKHLPIHVVQHFAGHSNITTTRKYYLVVSSNDLASATQVINKIMQV